MSGNPLPVMSKLIEDNGMIGDGETAALVCRGGSIDWLCWPRLDSPARFAARLAEGQHGCWRIAPTSAVLRQSRRYRQEHSSALGRALVKTGVTPHPQGMKLKGVAREVAIYEISLDDITAAGGSSQSSHRVCRARR